MNATLEAGHVPVFPAEAITALDVHPDGIYVDCTAGRGGHGGGILEKLGPQGRLLALDRDPQAVEFLRRRFGCDSRVEVLHRSYVEIEECCRERGIHGAVSGVLFDLGASSPQFDQPGRGFSFQHDGPLDMRFDTTSGPTAADWLNSASVDELAQVLRDFGEERHARRVARAIAGARATQPITRTGQLRDIVAAAVPGRERDRHPATRTFQAIRIRVNGELDAIAAALPQALAVLRTGGRLAIISFHSLEDRIVKRYLRAESLGDPYPPGFPVRAADLHPRLRLVGRSQRPGEAEVRANPRARSAVLRVAEKVAA